MIIDIRITCTHDALKFAETLARLLEAEQHVVRLTFGRQSLAPLEAAKTANEAVILIWSNNAPAQHYMLEWARAIPPARLVEIACAHGWPRFERRAPVIDFTMWRAGDRGARAWGALVERLDAIGEILTPTPRPRQRRVAMTLGLAGVAAVGGMIAMQHGGAPNPTAPLPQPAPLESAQVDFEEVAVGGATDIEAVEPPSMEDLLTVQYARTPRLRLSEPHLLENQTYELPDLRRPTLRERIGSLNPLRVLGDDGQTSDS